MNKIIKTLKRIIRDKRGVHQALVTALLIVVALVLLFLVYAYAKGIFFRFTSKPELIVVDATLIAPNRLVVTIKNAGGGPANVTGVRLVAPEGSTNFISVSVNIREGESKVIDVTISGISLPSNKNYIRGTIIFRLSSGEEISRAVDISIVRG